MICPIRELGFISEDSEETKECLEDECAWYDVKKNQCAILVIAQKSHLNVSLAR